jgi:hypothetical protein
MSNLVIFSISKHSELAITKIVSRAYVSFFLTIKMCLRKGHYRLIYMSL